MERAANPALEAGELWEQLRQLVEAMRKTAKEEIPPVQTDAEKLRVAAKDEFERGAKLVNESADKAPTQTNLPPATVAQRVAEMVPGLQRATNELANAERKVVDGEKKFSEAQKKLPEAQRDAAKAAEWAKAGGGSGRVPAAARRYLDRARALVGTAISVEAPIKAGDRVRIEACLEPCDRDYRSVGTDVDAIATNAAGPIAVLLG